MKAWQDYISAHRDRFVKELSELLRIPSISTDTAHKQEVQRCAELVKQYLEQAGADKVQIFPTAGHPVVYAEKHVSDQLPTVLVYGHYDVQPVDPLSLWQHDPFDPIIRDGRIYARGASDDKGQFFMHVKALEIMTRTQTLPVNLKFIIEGEEEIGSTHLAAFVQQHSDMLKCDVVLVSDTALISLQQPSIDVGVRGLAYVQVEVTGPDHDLHSGVYGGAVPNPATILCQMIAQLHDADNRVNIPGFYDDVEEIPAEERALLAKAPFDPEQFKRETGVRDFWGEKGYTTRERIGIRPTLEINGIWSGYTGAGAKTVLPSKAYAKISCRLVPHQDHQKITQLLGDHLKKIAPTSVQVDVKPLHGGDPYVLPISHPAYRAAARAMQATLGKEPVPVRGGGSIPITSVFLKTLGAHTVFLGFGLDDDCLHAPNEKFDLANFFKGIETIPYFHQFFAEENLKS
ncbi:MAG: dipeptidase [Thermoflavifilum aggregans]|nr:dipeptidase [Thermoflavifilum aggregans]